jgi:hypothetical protein
MSQNSLLRQIAVNTDQRIRSAISNDPTCEKLDFLEIECVKLEEEIKRKK